MDVHCPRLQLAAITKRYGKVTANDGVSLNVGAGEIHAVLGENGAGKSTLMKIIYGVTLPDSGEVKWNGAPVQMKNPHEARALGIAMVFQHFSLFDTLTVCENIALGLPGDIPMADLVAQIRSTGERYGLEVEPDRPVHSLSVGERQRVEIIRALLTHPQLLILDEPTSVLTPQAVQKLFVTLRQLASEGCSILYISHKLDEIRALCHRATVMRGGKVVGECIPSDETSESLSKLMIGGEVPRPIERSVRQAKPEPRLSTENLSLPATDAFSSALESISLTVHAGEIVGIAGVSGNGQNELMAALSGESHRVDHSAILLRGQPVGKLGAWERRELGLAFVPEERLGRGAVPLASLADNMMLSFHEPPFMRHGMIDFTKIRHAAMEIITKYRVKASGVDATAKSLSGGNLQKFIVGREIAREPAVLLVSQPTWGVDVGAAAQIHGQLIELRDRGCAILVVSDELDELMTLSDRLHVMAKGRLSPAVDTNTVSREQIGVWMSGLWDALPAREPAQPEKIYAV
jgi:ABC-type uncharacterized transport system ATPase subunit